MEAQAERLNDRRVLLAGFLKLAMFSVIDMKMAAPVFGQYLKVSSHQLLCLLHVYTYPNTSGYTIVWPNGIPLNRYLLLE